MAEDIKQEKGVFNKIIKMLLNAVVFFTCFIVAIMVVYVFFAQIHSKDENYKPAMSFYTIVSPSMNPVIKVYDVVVNVRVNDPSKIEVGDIITYVSTNSTSEGMTITHRVVAVYEKENGNYEYQTQGDNNSEPDSVLVTFDNVIGKEVVIIPALGKIQFLLANKKGWLFLLLIPIALFIFKDIYELLNLVSLRRKVDKVTGYIEEPERVVKQEKEKERKEIIKREIIINELKADALVRSESEGIGFLEPYSENIVAVGKFDEKEGKKVKEPEIMHIVKPDVIEELDNEEIVDTIKEKEKQVVKEVKPVVEKSVKESKIDKIIEETKVEKVVEKPIIEESIKEEIKEDSKVKEDPIIEKETILEEEPVVEEKVVIEEVPVEEEPVKEEIVEEQPKEEIVEVVEEAKAEEIKVDETKEESKVEEPLVLIEEEKEEIPKEEEFEEAELDEIKQKPKVEEPINKVNKPINVIKGEEVVGNTSDDELNNEIKELDAVISPIEILDTDELTHKIKIYDEKLVKLNKMLKKLDKMKLDKDIKREEVQEVKEEADEKIFIEEPIVEELIQENVVPDINLPTLIKEDTSKSNTTNTTNINKKELFENNEYLVGRQRVINIEEAQKKRGRPKKIIVDEEVLLKTSMMPQVKKLLEDKVDTNKEKEVKENKKNNNIQINNRKLNVKPIEESIDVFGHIDELLGVNGENDDEDVNQKTDKEILRELNNFYSKGDKDLVFNPKIIKKVDTNDNVGNIKKEKKKSQKIIFFQKEDKKNKRN